ncbi:MAG TPA: M20/M25/M40 family metallo-hydrolase [Vicinamibacteria bacterium]|nr:M20/M25/M40 family metallo-hydrolase [Vicinamibacteria bacterium]
MQSYIDTFWEETILPTLSEYIRIPNVSPAFDREWAAHGHMERALELVRSWLEDHRPEPSELRVGRVDGRTPLLLLEVPGDSDETVLMYGHLDKQPEMTGWRSGLNAWSPVREKDRLYGRGGADDGYAGFASVAALRALREHGKKHARVVLIIEFSEESGSPDLPAYVDRFAKEIGSPSLVICLDSGAGNYEQLWSTTSLRGIVAATLRVDVLTEGVHSGDASGIVASSFRIARQLLSRLEDERTGRILPEGLSVDIPRQRREQASRVAEALGEEVFTKFPWVPGMEPVSTDPTEAILNRTWRPALAVTGQEGIPTLDKAGNVLRPYTSVNLSLRIPPTLDPNKGRDILREILTREPPYGARVTLDFHEPAPGWNAPALAPWLARTLDEASSTYFGKQAMHMGEGGSIPFMGMLGEKFPEAQFVITGVLGPESNAHGPNEFLDIAYAKKLTAATAYVLEKHHASTE